MKVNPDFVVLVSLQKHWTTEQRFNYGSLDPQRALKFLVDVTGCNYGYSLAKWSLYYLLKEKNDIGIRVMVGRFTGSNQRRLQRFSDFLDAMSKYKRG